DADNHGRHDQRHDQHLQHLHQQIAGKADNRQPRLARRLIFRQPAGQEHARYSTHHHRAGGERDQRIGTTLQAGGVIAHARSCWGRTSLGVRLCRSRIHACCAPVAARYTQCIGCEVGWTADPVSCGDSPPCALPASDCASRWPPKITWCSPCWTSARRAGTWAIPRGSLRTSCWGATPATTSRSTRTTPFCSTATTTSSANAPIV